MEEFGIVGFAAQLRKWRKIPGESLPTQAQASHEHKPVDSKHLLLSTELLHLYLSDYFCHMYYVFSYIYEL